MSASHRRCRLGGLRDRVYIGLGARSRPAWSTPATACARCATGAPERDRTNDAVIPAPDAASARQNGDPGKIPVVKAVVMAGGEGTRLRPITSNQPKPMVPIAGKPCMEPFSPVRRHGIDNGSATRAYMPQVIRGYSARVPLDRTAYSVRRSCRHRSSVSGRAVPRRDLLVVSGDALKTWISLAIDYTAARPVGRSR